MRISTNTMFEIGQSRMNDLQGKLSKVQQQVASGKRILTPSDDPVGSATALNLSQGQQLNTQYATNRINARNALSQEEGVLQGVTSVIQDIKSVVVQAGNPVLDDTQRKFLATELQTRYQELISLANSRDGVGNYLFSGYQIATQPFTVTSSGVQYNGDQGQAALQVDTARDMMISDSGDTIFESINSTGTFAAAAAAANGGSAAVTSPLTVVDARVVTNHNYDIVFSGGNYSVFDLTLDPTKAGTPLVTGAFNAPQTITFDGRRVTVSGAPSSGDIVEVRPTEKQSLFKTFQDLITLLQSPGSGPVGTANLSHGLTIAHNNIDHALDNTLAIRASVGSRLKELEVLDSTGEGKNLQFEQAISSIRDLDYTKALTDLSKHQIILEAAQKSFVKVSGLSLFDLL